jgi:hypothetical protein
MKNLFVGIFAVILLCTIPSCSSLFIDPGDGSGTPNSFGEQSAEQRYIEWCNDLPRYIIPRMCAYYELYPERFKPAGHGEEIEIAGFAAFVKNDSYFKSGTRCYIVNGTIFDPWGQPLHFVQDINMDGYIEAMGERRIVLDGGVRGHATGLNKEHHFGICKQSPFKGSYGQPWERIFAETF